jgi:hypothetical protein
MGKRASQCPRFIRVELETFRSHPVGDAGSATRHQGGQNGNIIDSAVTVDLTVIESPPAAKTDSRSAMYITEYGAKN